MLALESGHLQLQDLHERANIEEMANHGVAIFSHDLSMFRCSRAIGYPLPAHWLHMLLVQTLVVHAIQCLILCSYENAQSVQMTHRQRWNGII